MTVCHVSLGCPRVEYKGSIRYCAVKTLSSTDQVYPPTHVPLSTLLTPRVCVHLCPSTCLRKPVGSKLAPPACSLTKDGRQGGRMVLSYVLDSHRHSSCSTTAIGYSYCNQCNSTMPITTITMITRLTLLDSTQLSRALRYKARQRLNHHRCCNHTAAT